jgi:uncharacterized protein
MAQDLFQYDKMIERALRGVVRDALAQVAHDAMPGDHHFYVSFATREPGVQIPASLLARFPEQMSIVLQHQFWDLEVGPEAFSVTLSFQRRPERLVIPFAAIKGFADPSVDFSLEFASPVTAPAETAAEPGKNPALPTPIGAAPQPERPEKAEVAEKAEKPAGEVVALDAFRKR